MDGPVVDPLLGLVDQHLPEELPGDLADVTAGPLQGLCNRGGGRRSSNERILTTKLVRTPNPTLGGGSGEEQRRGSLGALLSLSP